MGESHDHSDSTQAYTMQVSLKTYGLPSLLISKRATC